MFLREKRISCNNHDYTYLQLVESVKVEGRVKQNVLLNFGNLEDWPPEKFRKLLDDLTVYTGYRRGISEDEIDPEQALGYGPHLLCHLIWQRLGLDRFWQRCRRKHKIKFELEMAIKAMVFNRLTEPQSKLAASQWIQQQYIPGVDPAKLSPQHFYRALNVLEKVQEELEQWVYDRITDLLNFDLSLVFYDLTSSYFEGEGPALACHGYSRDHRPDCHQIQIGLLVNSDGIPIAHLVYDGSLSDQETLADIIKAMRLRFHLKRCIVVADDGIINTATAGAVKQAEYQTIWAAQMGKETAVADILRQAPDVAAAGAAWEKVKDNLWVWELPNPPGRLNDYRVVIVFNPIRQQSQRKKRERRLLETQAYLETFNARTKRGAAKNDRKVERQIDRWLRAKGTAKYFDCRRHGPYRLEFSRKESAIARDRLIDGMQILRTDAQHLTTTEVALGYRTLTQVEAAFDEIKNFIKLRPIRHWTDLRVKGHVAICVQAYLIESIIENILSLSRMPITARKALGLLSPLKVINLNLAGKVLHKTTRPTDEQLELLKYAGLVKFERMIMQ